MPENQENLGASEKENPQTEKPASENGEADARAERWKQQLRGREKQAKDALAEAEKAKAEKAEAARRAERYKQTLVAAVYVDGKVNRKALEKIAEEDQEMADEVARGFQIGNRAARDADELLSSLGDDADFSAKTPAHKAIDEDTLVEKLLGKMHHEKALDEVERLFSELPEGSQDKAVALFKDITEGKKNLTPEQAKRYANLVIKDLGVEKKSPTRKVSALASMGLGNASASVRQQPQDSHSDEDISDWLTKYGGPTGKALASIFKSN